MIKGDRANITRVNFTLVTNDDGIDKRFNDKNDNLN